MITTTVVYRLRPLRYSDNAWGIAADAASGTTLSRHYRGNPNVSWETFALEAAKQVCRAEASIHYGTILHRRLTRAGAIP